MFWVAAAVLVVATVCFSWMWVVGVPEGVSGSPVCAVLFLVPFTLLLIEGLIGNQRSRVSYFREGLVSHWGRPEAIAWDEVVAVRRARQDPEITTPPGWIISTRDGR